MEKKMKRFNILLLIVPFLLCINICSADELNTSKITRIKYKSESINNYMTVYRLIAKNIITLYNDTIYFKNKYDDQHKLKIDENMSGTIKVLNLIKKSAQSEITETLTTEEYMDHINSFKMR
jgi:hypothetical protein